MADGTILNGVSVPRIHKSNAKAAMEEAEDNITDMTKELLVLAVTSTPDLENVVFRVDELVNVIRRESWRAFAAEYIMEFPEDCEDELEPTP